MRARLGHLAGCVPGMCLEEITPALRKPWGGKGEGSLDRLSKAWGVYAPLVWHCSQFLPNERSSQVPQEESVSPTQVTSVWPLRFRVLCAHGSPVAEPVSVILPTLEIYLRLHSLGGLFLSSSTFIPGFWGSPECKHRDASSFYFKLPPSNL